MPKWQFEHFKTFVSYDIMQPAAACLLLFEGENTDGGNPKMNRLSRMLIERTGHPSWLIDRERGTGNLLVDKEGSVFRNKARLFSSFYIMVPPELLRLNNLEKQIMLTEFGKALALGYVSEKDYYDFIIKKFEYPHPVYIEEYKNWTDLNAKVRPFILVLKILVELYEKFGLENAFITSFEIYHFLQPVHNENIVEQVAKEIIEERGTHQLDTKVDTRKVDEMLSFLSKSGYIYIYSHESHEYFYLNLLERHTFERSLYFEKRRAGGPGTAQRKFLESKLDSIKKLWEE